MCAWHLSIVWEFMCYLRPAGILRRSTSVMSDGTGEVEMSPLTVGSGKQRRARSSYFEHSLIIYVLTVQWWSLGLHQIFKRAKVKFLSEDDKQRIQAGSWKFISNIYHRTKILDLLNTYSYISLLKIYHFGFWIHLFCRDWRLLKTYHLMSESGRGKPFAGAWTKEDGTTIVWNRSCNLINL